MIIETCCCGAPPKRTTSARLESRSGGSVRCPCLCSRAAAACPVHCNDRSSFRRPASRTPRCRRRGMPRVGRRGAGLPRWAQAALEWLALGHRFWPDGLFSMTRSDGHRSSLDAGEGSGAPGPGPWDATRRGNECPGTAHLPWSTAGREGAAQPMHVSWRLQERQRPECNSHDTDQPSPPGERPTGRWPVQSESAPGEAARWRGFTFLASSALFSKGEATHITASRGVHRMSGSRGARQSLHRCPGAPPRAPGRHLAPPGARELRSQIPRYR